MILLVTDVWLNSYKSINSNVRFFAGKSYISKKNNRSHNATAPIRGTLRVSLAQNQESNAILRQKNNLKLYYENNLQKTKSKP